MKFLCAFLFLTLLTMMTIQAESIQSTGSLQQVVTKAAFDLGSGKFKLMVADVCGDHIQIKYSEVINVSLGADYAAGKNGLLSLKAQQKATDAIRILKEKAIAHGATQFTGIATAIFRTAKNGEALLEKLSDESGVKLHIISQHLEGVIGFKTAAVSSLNIQEENIISIDSGGASFQLTFKDGEAYKVYEGPLGNALVAQALFEEVRGVPFDLDVEIGAMTLNEIDRLIEVLENKMEVSDWIKPKIADSKMVIVGVGHKDSALANSVRASKANPFTQQQLMTAIKSLANKSESDPSIEAIANNAPSYVLTRAILIYAIMHKFGIHQVLYTESPGGGPGIFVTEELWP